MGGQAEEEGWEESAPGRDCRGGAEREEQEGIGAGKALKGCRGGEGEEGEKRRRGGSLASFQNCLADMLIHTDAGSHE